MTSTFTVTVARLFMKEQKFKILKDMSNVFMMDKRTKVFWPILKIMSRLSMKRIINVANVGKI